MAKLELRALVVTSVLSIGRRYAKTTPNSVGLPKGNDYLDTMARRAVVSLLPAKSFNRSHSTDPSARNVGTCVVEHWNTCELVVSCELL